MMIRYSSDYLPAQEQRIKNANMHIASIIREIARLKVEKEHFEQSIVQANQNISRYKEWKSSR